ncbi:hypothetical protein MARBORIA2_08770 [Methanobrevibacter arboriphilus]|jgi:CDP-glycerol glycerophosphotransferase|uniref:Uncharacterized protein n=1 Tax=Methanobrevibacter arboriphilus TaxID=39441 RepID=A0ACA8R3V1_METAZ|nr:CDP-glycerol glycerophosphotransferase family protein [Methanobrevibacter arboriphilus]BBL62181.1 hypothetical protein MarbSA_12210 [Methanobrevibacter arboriphilus]GLI11787.1 hypothetical protein MARBORIA2_08770 [Methanobrevibacter arboriphilus]
MSKIKQFIKVFVRFIIIFFYKVLFNILSTKNIIMFESGNGRNYTGNPKYIYEYLINNSNYEYNDKFKYVWSVKDTKIKIPGNPIKVKKNRLKYLYYTIISAYWIFDARHPEYLLKKSKCKYIQTWHGTPLKKLGLDIENLNMGGKTNIDIYKSEIKNNAKIWDYLIAQNDFSIDAFKTAFNFKGEFLKVGYPRNDILINKKEDKDFILKIKDDLGILNPETKNKKIILYAPTWRDNEFYNNEIYKFASQMDFDLLKKELSDEYIMIIKYHYLVQEKIDWNKYSDFIKVADEKWDIQELYLISDMLITDYSSVMFDYALLQRPIIFYTYDLEFYKESLRGFYFDIIEEVPGPIIKNNQELSKYLKNFNLNEYFLDYRNKYSKFTRKYNQYDDGNASKKVSDIIKS